MDNFTIVGDPVVQRSLTTLRRRDTPQRAFREELERASFLLVARALQDLRTARVRVNTPLEPTEGVELDEEVVLVPVLRAGLSMVDAALRLVPDARIGHVGLYRDENTHRPVDYYLRLPDRLDESLVLVLDPMLATGGSAVRAIETVRSNGAGRIKLVCLIAAPEGVTRVHESYPDVQIVAAALDRELDAAAYIRPGLGDAGDRSFGTD